MFRVCVLSFRIYGLANLITCSVSFAFRCDAIDKATAFYVYSKFPPCHLWLNLAKVNLISIYISPNKALISHSPVRYEPNEFEDMNFVGRYNTPLMHITPLRNFFSQWIMWHGWLASNQIWHKLYISGYGDMFYCLIPLYEGVGAWCIILGMLEWLHSTVRSENCEM